MTKTYFPAWSKFLKDVDSGKFKKS
jgi:hypothetical protein